jgi:hypothetical protein
MIRGGLKHVEMGDHSGPHIQTGTTISFLLIPNIFVFILLSKQDLFFKTKKERDMQFICTLFLRKKY